jgi:hypothetical protein
MSVSITVQVVWAYPFDLDTLYTEEDHPSGGCTNLNCSEKEKPKTGKFCPECGKPLGKFQIKRYTGSACIAAEMLGVPPSKLVPTLIDRGLLIPISSYCTEDEGLIQYGIGVTICELPDMMYLPRNTSPITNIEITQAHKNALHAKLKTLGVVYEHDPKLFLVGTVG